MVLSISIIMETMFRRRPGFSSLLLWFRGLPAPPLEVCVVLALSPFLPFPGLAFMWGLLLIQGLVVPHDI